MSVVFEQVVHWSPFMESDGWGGGPFWNWQSPQEMCGFPTFLEMGVLGMLVLGLFYAELLLNEIVLMCTSVELSFIKCMMVFDTPS